MMASHPRAPRRCLAPVVILALNASAMAACAHARPTESWPELGHRLSPGKSVTVTTAAGSEVAGRVSAVSADSLVLTVDGVSRQLAPGDVRQVRRNGDPLWNGLVIGAAIGATAAALPDPKRFNCGAPEPCQNRQLPQRLTVFAGVTVAGLVIDVLHRDRTVLYRSPGSASPGSGSATDPAIPASGRTNRE